MIYPVIFPDDSSLFIPTLEQLRSISIALSCHSQYIYQEHTPIGSQQEKSSRWKDDYLRPRNAPGRH
jgi:hypothetical protein